MRDMSDTPEVKLNKLVNERQNWSRIMSRIRTEIDELEDHLCKFPASRAAQTQQNKLKRQLKKYKKILDRVNEEITELENKFSLKVEQLPEEQVTRPVVTSVQIICNRCGSHNVRDSFNEKTMTARYECLTCGNIKEVQR